MNVEIADRGHLRQALGLDLDLVQTVFVVVPHRTARKARGLGRRDRGVMEHDVRGRDLAEIIAINIRGELSARQRQADVLKGMIRQRECAERRRAVRVVVTTERKGTVQIEIGDEQIGCHGALLLSLYW